MIALSILLDAMTFDTLENSLGATLIGLFGGSSTGIYLMGMLFLIVVAFFSIKAGVGFEGTIILSAFGLFLITQGISVTGGGQGGILPIWFLVVFVIAVGFVVYLAFFKREF
jgi:hypothetical protein